MKNSLSHWEDALNDGLVNRLTRPLRQAGMMNRAMGERIINRCDRFLTRLPLLSQQMQRWGNTNTLSYDAVPIVYGQPISLPKEQNLGNIKQNSQLIVSQNQPAPTIIQRKLDSSQSLATRTVSNPIPVQNSTDLSNSPRMSENSQNIQTDLSANLSPTRGEALKPTFDLKLDETYIYASEIPVVSPLPISEQLLTTEEMGLAGLTQSPISSPTISELNINQPSDFSREMENLSPNLSPSRGEALKPTFDLKLDETSIYASEIPVVSPLPISEQLLTTEEMGLVGLRESPISAPTISELNNNQQSDFSREMENLSPSRGEALKSTFDLKLDKTYISSSEIPVVSPQPISDFRLPIIQAKLQNYSQSQSSLPTVNNLNTLVEQQQTQQNNYLENFRGINHEKLISEVSAKALPIVNAQNLKSQLSLARNAPNYQNQPATFINKQPVNISPSQITQTHNQQNFSPLPVVSVTSVNNSSLKPQSSPLPLAKATPSSRSNSQQPNLSNRNSISNTDSSSTTRTFASSLSPTETSVSPASSRNVDIDVNAIASQVERKLMRKLVIESERRGKIR